MARTPTELADEAVRLATAGTNTSISYDNLVREALRAFSDEATEERIEQLISSARHDVDALRAARRLLAAADTEPQRLGRALLDRALVRLGRT